MYGVEANIMVNRACICLTAASLPLTEKNIHAYMSRLYSEELVSRHFDEIELILDDIVKSVESLRKEGL